MQKDNNITDDCRNELGEDAGMILFDIYQNGQSELINNLRGSITEIALKYSVRERDLYDELYDMEMCNINENCGGRRLEERLDEVFQLLNK